MTTERLAPFQIHPPVGGYSFIASGHIWGSALIVHRVTAKPISYASIPMTVSDRGVILRMLKAERTPESIYALDRLTCLHSGTPTHQVEIGYSFVRNPATVVTLFSMSLDFSIDSLTSDHVASECCRMICKVMLRSYLRSRNIRPLFGNSALTARSNATRQYWISLLLIRYQWELLRRKR